MKNTTDLEFEFDEISSEVAGNVVVLSTKCNAFGLLTDLHRNNNMTPWFKKIEQEDSINAVLFLTAPDCLNEKNYDNFLQSIADHSMDDESGRIRRFEDTGLRAIEINMLLNYIQLFLEFKKPIITALQGQVVTPFFGITLSTDFRVASEKMSFSLSHAKYGLHPSGGLPFFLPRYIGYGRAKEYLMQGGEISARAAKELGLISEVFPKEGFRENVIKYAQKVAGISPELVRSTKYLMNVNPDELEEFFKKESNFMFH